ncbi:MAG: DUF5668 domain-containing protein [Bacteroidota bacterium]
MGAKPKIAAEKSPRSEFPPESQPQRLETMRVRRSRDQGSMVGGAVLIVLGLFFLAKHFFPRFDLFDYWPLVLIAIGAGLLWKAGGR